MYAIDLFQLDQVKAASAEAEALVEPLDQASTDRKVGRCRRESLPAWPELARTRPSAGHVPRRAEGYSTAAFSCMPQIRIPEIRERVESIYMKSGLLTTRLYIWIVTISLASVRQEFFGRAASLGAG